MYSATELAKIFKTSRKTIYVKLKAPEIKDFVTQTEKGLRLEQEGFNVLQVLLSTSKLGVTTTEEVKNDVTSESDRDELVNILKEQLDELREEKEELKKEKVDIQKKYDAMVGVLIEHQKQQLLLEAEKSKSFWKRVFRI